MATVSDAYGVFLSSGIKCLNCGAGPSNFSTYICYNTTSKTWNTITKYENFCSTGCCISFNVKDEETKAELAASRSSTP